MTYFTILHWFAVIVIGLLTILIIVLSVRNHDGKSSLLSPILATLFIMTIFAIFAIFSIAACACCVRVGGRFGLYS